MRNERVERTWKKVARRSLVASAALAAFGLSACERDARPAPESDQRTAQVSIYNATHDVLPLYSQPLNLDYGIDCDLVLAAPETFVREEHLSMPEEDFIFSGMEHPLEGVDDRPGSSSSSSPPCHLNVISTADDRLSEIAVSWPGDLEEKTFYTDVDAPADVPPEGQTLVVEADYEDIDEERLRPWQDRPCGGSIENCSQEEFEDIIEPIEGARYEWSVVGDAPTIHDWSFGSIDDAPVDDEGEECATGRDATQLTWEEPPSDIWRVDAVRQAFSPEAQNSPAQDTSSPEDPEDVEQTCFVVELSDEETQEEWEFCGSQRLAARLASEEKVGTVHAQFYTDAHYGSPPSGYETLTVDIERRTDEGERFETELIEAVRGQSIPEHIGLDWEAVALTDCQGRREVKSCDQMILPALLQVDSPGGTLEIPAGRTDYLEPQTHRRIEVVRAMHRVVADRGCREAEIGPYQFAEVGPYMELIYYAGVSVVGEK